MKTLKIFLLVFLFIPITICSQAKVHSIVQRAVLHYRISSLVKYILKEVTVNSSTFINLGCEVNSVVFNKAEDSILASSSDGRVKIISLSTGHETEFHVSATAVNSALYNGDESAILTASSDGFVRLTTILTDAKREFPISDEAVNSAVFRKNDPIVLAALANGTVCFINANTRELTGKIKVPNSSVNSAIFDSSETMILAASSDGSVMLFNVGKGQSLELKSRFKASGSSIRLALFRADDTEIVTASSSGEITIINIATSKVQHSWNTGGSAILNATMSRDGKKIFIASINNK